MNSPIKTALISVSDKTGIAAFCRFLAESGVKILSTGGTAQLLRSENIPVTDVSEHTGFPEIMDGRVKTLHPKIHGGLLGRREDKNHVAAMGEHGIAPIDLVVVSLYPFEAVVAKGAPFEDCIENIDIGGPSMIRSAAKNHESVTVLVNPADYEAVREAMQANNGATTPELRKQLAAKAYARTAAYDAAIANWFMPQVFEDAAPTLLVAAELKQTLRYGENPHQKAAAYALPGENSLLAGKQMQGKELSYNNINDAHAALALIKEFKEPAVAIIKHANPCGVAVGKDAEEAYKKALACDPQSAFGGIIAFNRKLDAKAAEAAAGIFSEVILAPDADADALEILSRKKNLRVLLLGEETYQAPATAKILSVSGGYLVQEPDVIVCSERDLQMVTENKPSAQQMEDMLFAFAVVKHVKSNAIVLAGGGSIVGIGAGQMSRVDSVRLAIRKAGELGHEVKGSVLASDAFFPFEDNVEVAAEAGIAAVIQPGGSVRDKEVIAAAEKHNISMILTGIRHFNH